MEINNKYFSYSYNIVFILWGRIINNEVHPHSNHLNQLIRDYSSVVSGTTSNSISVETSL